MRLWSLHPKYFDTKGLVAVWRESLLAKKALQGKTKGYTKHPQLIRFKNHPSPLEAIDCYLSHIFFEAKKRGYNFERRKIGRVSRNIKKIKVTSGQVDYELNHLKNKLRKRGSTLCNKTVKTKKIKVHPLFTIVIGDIEPWERQKP
ncbi:MAG TPA: pyrimidine dimer DNA glycosylase/endonuclease V [Patescibacteria group bacterium]|nr:pyrimidine dimer DNA glycosylase/endonuclease V [Patescibacteria group bacterium]